MATTTSSVRNLVGVESILFIRPQTLRIDIYDARPNTRLYAFFDGERVDSMIRPAIETPGVEISPAIDQNGTISHVLPSAPAGSELKTTERGRLTAFFDIPGGRFNTGDKDIIFADTEDLDELEIPGSVHGYARAMFRTSGTTQIYQRVTTVTTTTEVEVTREQSTMQMQHRSEADWIRFPCRCDPLAQSFFTYGFTGGVFITGIDLYFQSKDPVVPVTIEIRPLINGFPGPLDETKPDLITYKFPEDIVVSNDASLPTRFTFSIPLYLPEDSDFCFVVRSNSNNYNIWTSKMGEKSIEIGYVIHEQPYVGSLFKSENNVTWIPEQFEDIKFTLYRAEFDVNATGGIRFTGTTPARAIEGTRFTTTAGSNLVVLRSPHFHGLTPGSKIDIATDASATYNGIAAADLSGSFSVTRKIDDYFVEFAAGGNATVSGPINSCGIVRAIAVVDAGSGYTSAPSVVIGDPSSGTTATATAVVHDGKVVRIELIDQGSGYTSNPSVIISGGGGSGANAIAIAEALLTVTNNTPYNWVSPQFRYSVPPDTKIGSSIDSVYETYGYPLTPTENRIDGIKIMEETRMVASRTNEFNLLSNNPSFAIDLELLTTNKNVSPVIDTRNAPSVLIYTNAINNQARSENVDDLVTDASTFITGYTITNGGTGYVSAPAVTVIAAENDRNKNNIVPASITASITGGVVDSLTIVDAGSGYTAPPIVVFDPPSSGTTATASVEIGPFNSELMTSGSAYSRYLTKKLRLTTISSGIRLLVDAKSSHETTFDWYIRTSLSGDVAKHEDSQWRLLKCDVQRDRSSNSTQFFEYEFYLDNIPPFDTYDMKMVPSTNNRAKIPYIRRYRAIVVV